MKRYHEGRKSLGIIKENRSARSLLPTEVIDREWPEGHSYHMKYTDTLFSGVQDQLKEDSADFGKASKPGKY